jgi:hypothetical protein
MRIVGFFHAYPIPADAIGGFLVFVVLASSFDCSRGDL